MRRICCWNNCHEIADGDLPQGWVNLFVYESPQPNLNIFKQKNWHKHRRDGVLCAQHAFMLDRLLMPLPLAFVTDVTNAETPAEGTNQGVVLARAPEPPKTSQTVN